MPSRKQTKKSQTPRFFTHQQASSPLSLLAQQIKQHAYQHYCDKVLNPSPNQLRQDKNFICAARITLSLNMAGVNTRDRFIRCEPQEALRQKFISAYFVKQLKGMVCDGAVAIAISSMHDLQITETCHVINFAGEARHTFIILGIPSIDTDISNLQALAEKFPDAVTIDLWDKEIPVSELPARVLRIQQLITAGRLTNQCLERCTLNNSNLDFLAERYTNLSQAERPSPQWLNQLEIAPYPTIYPQSDFLANSLPHSAPRSNYHLVLMSLLLSYILYRMLMSLLTPADDTALQSSPLATPRPF